MSDHYILDGHKAVKTDLMTWARMFEKAGRVVRKTTIGDAEVSTVFLGLDHQYGDGPPLIFETMVFGGTLDQEQDRCTTWEEAEAMHEAMCERVRSNVLLCRAGPGNPKKRGALSPASARAAG